MRVRERHHPRCDAPAALGLLLHLGNVEFRPLPERLCLARWPVVRPYDARRRQVCAARECAQARSAAAPRPREAG
eukprot:1057103-Prymnesium_polylepis.1